VLAVVLAATVALTVVLPVPLVGDRVIHDTPDDDVVNAQPAWVVTEIGSTCPLAGTEADVGDTVNVHAVVPVCVTVIGWPATVAVPVRVAVPVLGATFKVTVPFPVPPAGETPIQLVSDAAIQAQPDVVATLTDVGPPALPTDALVGATVNPQSGAPACVTVTARPAIVAVAVRAVVLVLGAIASVAAPLPVALAGTTLIQTAPGEVVHVQPALVDTFTVEVALGLPTDTLVGATVNVQAPAAWVTLTALPAMVTVPVRGEVLVLAAIVNVALPLPEPLVGAAVIQDAPEEVVHAQPEAVVTDTVTVPPAAATDRLVDDTE